MDDQAILRTLRPAAGTVGDPITGDKLWLSGVIREPHVHDGALRYTLRFGADYSDGVRQRLRELLRAAIRAQGFHGPIDDPIADADAPAAPARPPLPPGVGAVVAVASGKGGVGKSTIATNLAVGLGAAGLRVGLLDADVHGPSVPRMMGTRQRQLVGPDKRIQPVRAHGVGCVSMGFVVDPEAAMIWRGPMVANALQQLLGMTAWGELDVLVLDLPPGTGDAQLTLVQTVGITGAVVVTTPQEVALEDALRGIRMFREVGVDVLGVVENMAWYVRQDGTRDPVFGEGGGARLAAREGVPLLGQVPLQTAIRQAGDDGRPAVSQPTTVGEALRGVVEAVRRRLAR